MNVLLLGSGGRESALAWALSRSRAVSSLVAAPGNPGIAQTADLVDVDIEDPRAVVDAAHAVDAGLVVVGPEAPLVAGVADALRAAGRRVFGPDASAALVEGSKAHAKQLMERAGVPTAAWRSFEDAADAVAHLDEIGPPYVVKADGLASGKGVVVTEDREEAAEAARASLVAGRFGDAGRRVLIEEFLDGQEASLIALTDGAAVLVCEPAQDYKRVLDDDRGPNTGGMGSYSPVPALPPEPSARIVDEIVEPMVAASRASGAPFVGALYAGLALTARGPRVLEFNARFGDPETQSLLPRLRSDLGEVCLACASGDAQGYALEWSPQACVCLVLAAAGYPGAYEEGTPIEGVEDAAAMDRVEVFHSGTARRGGDLVTAGGRVLAVSALGDG
ncbi:MAG: phosphoribosylamine--glycine ligase, partial [Actinomycetota bacterium]